MNVWNKTWKTLIAGALCFTGIFSGFQVSVRAASENLALGKSVTASTAYVESDLAKLTDGDESKSSRWRTETAPTQWAYVDLGESKEMNKFEMVWEDAANYATAFNIYVSDNTTTWGNAVASVTGNTSERSTVEVTDKQVKGRYVKLEVTAVEGYQAVSCSEFKIFNDPVVSSSINLALNKEVTASSAPASTLPKTALTDGDETTRWSSEAAPIQWAYVDLGKSMTVNKYEMLWESNTEYAKSYNIYVSDSTTTWGDPVVAVTNNTAQRSIEFSEDVQGRYVKLEVTAVSNYPSVSCFEFKIFNQLDVPQDPTENIALNKNATASSYEAESVRPGLAVDGNTSSNSSRWGSNGGSTTTSDPSPWIYVDFGKQQDVKTIKLFWQNRKATAYKIQVADTLSSPMADSDWTTVKTFNQRPAMLNEKIVLDNVQKARYVRLLIDSFTAQDPDGGVEWCTVSLYEIEIYGGDIKASIDDIANDITIDTPQKGDTELSVHMPNDNDFTVEYNGTDLEQIVDDQLHIFTPIVDKEVKVSFKVTDKNSGAYRFSEVPVTIPGTYSQAEGDNAAPVILPELQEWKGNSGTFNVASSAKVVYANDELKATAETFAQDYLDLTGKPMSVVKGTSAGAGEFLLSLTTDKTKGLLEEGYLMEITDKVSVEAETATGAFWATRTILQSIKQTGDIPCGITRDYPLYKVRGYILDVGRKTFTMDHLEQMVKLMSWYKMNDFQIHLNDNLIPLENLGTEDKIMQAYSAFRLESNIKKGGNNGLNQADLTSTDVFYTKDEFRNLIKESRTYGVNVVPEIDTPAHSLALTKVRPDLRLGLAGRSNDHLNLTGKYAECLQFVQSIFNEYLEGADPVFDADTIVHVGADEFSANQNAYVDFAADMLEYVKATGRQTRIWGSLSESRKQGADITKVNAEDVQINLWNGGWADMKEMYDLGFDLINCNDGQYYIVPNAGYYYDYLNNNTVYNDPINKIGANYVPAGDKQMLGGAFAVWNDMTDYLENGISEYDVYDRIKTATSLFGAKLWGKGSMDLQTAQSVSAQLGDAPNTNFGYDVDSKEDAIANYPMDSMNDATTNAKDLTAGKNAEITSVDGKNALELKGNESYVNTKYTTVGLGNDLRVKVKRTSESNEEQILFESDYGTIKAVQKGTGKVGFSRENRDYSFSYTLPVNEWVELEFKNEHNVAKLYVNGTLVDTLGDGEQVEGRPLLATTMFPFARIGSTTKSFIGYVDDVRIGANDTFQSTMSLDHAIINANQVLKEHDNEELKTVVAEAKEVFKKYAPTAQEIKTYTDRINALLQAIDYEKADYSRVDFYLDLVPEDLSMFTPESVDSLNFVIANIQKDLPLSMQDTVDGYEKALAQALQELTLVDYVNPNYIEVEKLTATASSYQDNSSHPDKVLDGDPTTMWHTQWSLDQASDLPHWISLEISEPSVVEGLVYTPRANVGNGTVTRYQIEVSDDGNNWTKVAEGTWERTSGDKIATFDKVTTKHVRLVVLAAQNNNGSAAEIRLMKGDVPADFDGLNRIIATAEERLQNDQYSEESLVALAEVVKDAKAVAENTSSDANAVEIAKRNLYEAIGRLVLKDKPKPADKLSLESAIARAEAITADDLAKVVSQDAIKEFQDALSEAKAIMENKDATQEEVDASVDRLSEALHQLAINTIGDKTALSELVNAVSGKQSSDYTPQSWSVFANALSKAKEVLANAKATQGVIDEALQELTKANDGLRKVNTPSNPDDPDQPDDNEFIFSMTDKGSDITVVGKFPIGTELIVNVLQSKPVRDVINLIKDKSIVKKYNFEKVYDIYMMKDGVVYRPDGTFQVRIKLDKELQKKALKVLYIADDGKVTEIESTVKDGYITFATNHNSYYAIVSEKTGNGPITDTGVEPIGGGCMAILLVGGLMLLFTKKMEDVLD